MTRYSQAPAGSVQTLRSLGCAVAVALLPLIGACNASIALQQGAEARQLAITLQAELGQAVEASNRAVMTEADPASSESAKEAEAARARVKRSARSLDRLLAELQYADERALLEEFHGCFAAYEVLDSTILGLAIEKSNVKATRLAFGPAREAADAFKRAISQPPAADAQVRAWALEAIVAVRELQTLEPLHIAEPHDLAMTRMEQQMSAHEAAARAALAQLAGSLGAAALKPALTALDRFVQTNAEIVALSKRNTNVRSLELTLGQKRKIVATCAASLRALQQALMERARRPTR